MTKKMLKKMKNAKFAKNMKKHKKMLSGNPASLALVGNFSSDGIMINAYWFMVILNQGQRGPFSLGWQSF